MGTLVENCTEVNTLSGQIDDAIVAKGGTLVGGGKLRNAVAGIDSIPSGSQVLVNTWEVDANGLLSKNKTTFSIDSSVKKLGYASLRLICYFPNSDYSVLEQADLSSVEYADSSSLQSAFEDCKNLRSVDFTSLKEIDGAYTFYTTFRNCQALTSISFPSAYKIAGYMTMNGAFTNCVSLISVDFSHVTTWNDNYCLWGAFSGCNNLVNVYFNGLTTSIVSTANSAIPFGCPNTSCVFHCSDGTIEYINGAWTPVYSS